MLDVPVGSASRGSSRTMAGQMVVRIAISTAVAAVVAATVLLVGWRGIGSWHRFRMEQARTLQALRDFNSNWASYQRQNKSPPQEELRSFLQDCYRGNMPSDGWGRPFVYSVQDGKPILLSYGRDGKPGGIGLDNDLSNEDLPPVNDGSLPEKVRPTFSQFFADPSARGVELNCLCSGLLAFGLCLTLVRTITLCVKDVTFLMLKLVFTTGGALATAWFMGFLDIPNQH
jgi:hypothetical protein